MAHDITPLLSEPPKPLGLNGKTEIIRLIISALVSAVLAFFALRQQVAVSDQREVDHYTELKQMISDVKTDVHEMRMELRK